MSLIEEEGGGREKKREREKGEGKVDEGGSLSLKDVAVDKLEKEIDSWNAFAEALRIEDKELFKEMLRRCWNYSDSVEKSYDATEALLISLLVSQQKEINSLSKSLELMIEDQT